MFTHRFFKRPLRIYTQAIENTKKKDISTRIVSCSNGSAERTDSTRTCRPLILVIALSGLNTLKALSEFRLSPPSLGEL